MTTSQYVAAAAKDILDVFSKRADSDVLQERDIVVGEYGVITDDERFPIRNDLFAVELCVDENLALGAMRITPRTSCRRSAGTHRRALVF